jgi:hypothetical protein
MNPTNAALAALAAAALVAAGALFQDSDDAPVWVQSELEALSARIQADVEQLRGAKFDGPVPVKVADKATLVEYMKRRTAEDTPPERLAAEERMSKMFGMIPPDMDMLAEQFRILEDQVGGFYDPSTKTFYLMDSMPKGIAGVILAHELVHALDDQLFDLDAPLEGLKDNTDAKLAYHSVIEGSGTAAMNTWMIQHLGEMDFSGYQEMTTEQTALLANTPPWLWRPLLAMYLQGATFVTRSESLMQGQAASAKSDDITRAFRERPRSTEQVLHPDKYWDPELRDEPHAVAISVGALPDEWTVQLTDTLGELMLALITAPPEEKPLAASSDPTEMLDQLLEPFTHSAVDGWDGDRIVLLSNGRGSWMRLVTVWDSERDAGEFHATLSARLPGFERACEALSDQLGTDAQSGSELVYGEQRDVVVLTLWAGVERRRDRRVIEDAVTHTVE